MRRFVQFALALVLACGGFEKTARAADGDEQVERELVQLERLKSLYAAAAREAAELKAENAKLRALYGAASEASRRGDGDKAEKLRALMRAQEQANAEKVQKLEALYRAAGVQLQSMPKLEAENAVLRQKVEKLRSLYQIATAQAASGKTEDVLKAAPHLDYAARIASQIDFGEAGPQLLCSPMYAVGEYAMTSEGRECATKVAEYVKAHGPGTRIGLTGMSDEIRCSKFGKRHDVCDWALAGMRAAAFYEVLRKEHNVVDVTVNSLFDQKRGMRMVEVWALPDAMSAFASQFKKYDLWLKRLDGNVQGLLRRMFENEQLDRGQQDQLNDHEDRLRALEGKSSFRWGNIDLGVRFRLLDSDPNGEIVLSGELLALNGILGLDFGAAVGIGRNPGLDQSHSDAIIAKLYEGFVGIRFWVHENWSIPLVVSVGATNTGSSDEHDEIIVGVEGGLRFTSGAKGDWNRLFVQLTAGYTRGIADDFEDRNLFSLTGTSGIHF